MNQRRGSLLKEHATLLETLFRLLDPLLVVLTAYVCYVWYLNEWELPEHYWYAMFTTSLLILTIFPFFRIYRAFRGASLWTELQGLISAWAAVWAILAVLFFSTKTGAAFSRVWLGASALSSLAVLVMSRVMLRWVLRRVRERGFNQRYIIVAGAGALGEEVVRRLRGETWAGLQVVALFDDKKALHGTVIEGVPVRGGLEGVREFVDEARIDQVWITLPLRAEQRVKDLLQSLSDTTVELRFIPDIFGFQLLNHSLTEVAGLPVVNVTESPMQGANRILKALLDFVVAAVVLIVLSPLMLLIAVAVKVSSPGPALYTQRRVTWNGAEFNILKFRTMPVGAESDSGPVWARPDEDRATPIGKFLRRWSLDELPQFINVLRGEMSVVGPRPERPEFIEQFRHQIPGYMQKHLVKAGITGWAQVNDLRGNSDLTARIEYDLFYIDNWSIWFDLRIILLTMWQVLKSRNAY